MLAALARLVRADLQRQKSWIETQIGRQARYGARTAGLAAAGALAALGAVIVGLIALYHWLTVLYGPLTALGLLGAALAVLALILFTLAFARHRPGIASPPPLQSTSPDAVLSALKQGSFGETLAAGEKILASVQQGSYREAMAAGEQVVGVATDNLRHGSRTALYGTLALAALAGIVLGRKV